MKRAVTVSHIGCCRGNIAWRLVARIVCRFVGRIGAEITDRLIWTCWTGRRLSVLHHIAVVDLLRIAAVSLRRVQPDAEVDVYVLSYFVPGQKTR